MKKVAEAWHLLPDSEQAKYNARSAAEFKAQRQSFFQKGIYVREQIAKNQLPPEPEPSNQDLPEISSMTVLRSGTYGKVSLAFSKDGRPVALKLFPTRTGKQETCHEIEQRKALNLLKGMGRQWFPSFHGR